MGHGRRDKHQERHEQPGESLQAPYEQDAGGGEGNRQSRLTEIEMHPLLGSERGLAGREAIAIVTLERSGGFSGTHRAYSVR